MDGAGSEDGRSEEVRGQRLGALQAALPHTRAQHGLSTCITFHHRTMEAQAYAEGLQRVAAKLHADQPEAVAQSVGMFLASLRPQLSA